MHDCTNSPLSYEEIKGVDIDNCMFKLDCKISSRTIFISSDGSDISMYFLSLCHIIPDPHIFS